MSGQRYYLMITGTAGSGKTRLTKALGDWLESQGVGFSRVNLDPAVEWIPYHPDVDVRDYVSARRVMQEHQLGPNGALLAAIDLLHNHVDEIAEAISGSPGPYVLVDTPGQLELFAYRRSSLDVIRGIVNPYTTVVVFLIDGVFLNTPTNLASLLALALSVQLRLGYPQVNAISKADLLEPEMLELVEKLNEEPESLLELMWREEGPYKTYAEKIYRIVVEEGISLLPVSSAREEGLSTVFGEAQKALGIEEGIETSIDDPL